MVANTGLKQMSSDVPAYLRKNCICMRISRYSIATFAVQDKLSAVQSFSGATVLLI